jgi:Tfp pilus assembly protein PilO
VVITNVQIKDLPKKTVATDAAELTRLSRPFAIDIQGDFSSIRSLVEDIGTLRRQITVESVQFNLTDVLGKKKLRATVTMSVHYFGIEKKIGVAETAPAGGENATLTR